MVVTPPTRPAPGKLSGQAPEHPATRRFPAPGQRSLLGWGVARTHSGRSFVTAAARKVAALLAVAAFVPVLVGACSGAPFEGGGEAGASSNGGSPTTGGTSSAGATSSAGSYAGGSAGSCGGPEDCNDKDNCTNDFCTTQGVCASAPKCSGPEMCCNGDCAECCDDMDCDDSVGCTTNTCFAGKCMFVPNDAACGPEEFCSITESCRPLIACDGADPNSVTCSDSSPCTTDSCANGFCRNEFCEQGNVCCSTGCAEQCCADSDCRSTDPCFVGSCQGGKCQTVARCEGNDKCCPSLDAKSASCGSCCSAVECDDNVGCTVDTCTGARLACTNTPSDSLCRAGEVCSADHGCSQQVECQDAGDCQQNGCGRCEQGVCKYDCPVGKSCCEHSNSCALCCGDAACDDGISCTVDQCGSAGCTHTASDFSCTAGYICRPELGGCVQCTTAAHCDDRNTCTKDGCNLETHTCTHLPTCECQTGFDCQGVISQPNAAIPPVEGTPCPSCVDGQCQIVQCSGSCCSSGCYFGLCPD